MSGTDGRMHDVIVVGGGITGLAAAWRLKDHDVVVLEATDRVGGRIRSEDRGENWINIGAHLFPPPDSATGRLVTEVGLETEPISGEIMAIASNGKLVKGGRDFTYPFRLRLSLSGRLAMIKVGLKLKYAAWRLKRQDLTGVDAQSRSARLAFMGDRTFADFIGDTHPEVKDLFRVISQRLAAPMDSLSAGSGVNVVGHVWSKSADQVRNLRGGSSRLPEAIAEHLGERVVTGAAVTSVVVDDDHVQVSYTRDGQSTTLSARAVVVATPAFAAAEVLQDLPPEVEAALRGVKYGPYVAAGIVTSESVPMPWDDVYAIATPGRAFNMLFNVVNILRSADGPRTPGGSFMCYGGGEAALALIDKTDEEIRTAFLDDLYEVLPQTRGIVSEVEVLRIPHGMPYCFPGRHRLQAGLERSLAPVFLAGDYFDWADLEAAVSTANKAAAGVRELLAGEASSPDPVTTDN